MNRQILQEDAAPRMRILVVEDDEPSRALLETALGEQGWPVESVSSGEDAIARCTGPDGSFDAIVLDLILPGIDGLEVCRRLRETGCNSAILILSAKGAVDDRVRGLEEGADDYLPKPFDLGELAARLRALVRRRPNRTEPEVRLGPIRLDRIRRRVLLDGEPVPLTSREFALFDYLARNIGRFVSRQELAEVVWNDGVSPSSNTIEVHVNRLRRKLEDDDAELIVTRRGEGYAVVAH